MLQRIVIHFILFCCSIYSIALTSARKFLQENVNYLHFHMRDIRDDTSIWISLSPRPNFTPAKVSTQRFTESKSKTSRHLLD